LAINLVDGFRERDWCTFANGKFSDIYEVTSNYLKDDSPAVGTSTIDPSTEKCVLCGGTDWLPAPDDWSGDTMMTNPVWRKVVDNTQLIPAVI